MDNSRKIVFFEKYLSAFVFFLVFIAYIPSLFNGFVDWDDAPLIIFNNEFRGLGIKQIRWMFSTFHMSHYQPLSWLSLAADYCLWGLNPFGYHITNVILHSFSAALTARLSFIFFRKAGLHTEEALSGAAIAALFWALHPLRTESVSWITERRDVLSAALFMLSMFLYVKTEIGSPGFSFPEAANARPVFFNKKLITCFAVYVMACLSKSMAVTLPAVFLIIDFYPLKRLNFSFPENGSGISFSKKTIIFFKKNFIAFFYAAAEKTPFFAFAASFSAFYYFVVGKAIDVPYIASYMPSAAKALYAYWFYLYKTLLPFGLSPVYVQPEAGYAAVNAAGGIFLILILLAALRNFRKYPFIIAAAGYYAVTLLPACGLLNGAPVPAADRYSYIPGIGISVMAGGIFAAIVQKQAGNDSKRKFAAVFALAWLLAITCMGAKQQAVWRNSYSVWNRAAEIEPRSAIAQNNLASLAYSHGDRDKAERLMNYAMSLAPDDFNITFNCGNLYSMIGNYEKAAWLYAKVIEEAPSYYEAYIRKAEAERSLGRLDESERSLVSAVSARPQYPAAWQNLAVIRLDMKKYAEAEQSALRAAGIFSDPEALSESLLTAAIAAAAQRRFGDAANLCRRAVSVSPVNKEAAEFLSELQKALHAEVSDKTASEIK